MTARKRGGRLPIPLIHKVLFWVGATLFTLLLLGLFAYMQLISYLQGEAFRNSLETFLSNKMQAESVELDGTLSLDGGQIALPGFSILRPGLLHSLAARTLRAELKRAALLDRHLHITHASARECTLGLDADSIGDKLPTILKAKGGFWARLTPTQISIERLDCKDFNASLRMKGQDFLLRDSSLSANPLQGRKGWEIHLNAGSLHTQLPILGDCKLESATFMVGQETLTLSPGRIMLTPGELIANAIYEVKSSKWSSEFRINRADVGRLLSADWKKRLTGELYGRLNADGDTRGRQKAEGSLSLQQGVLEALPFLSELPVGNTYPYRHLRLDKATARLSYPYSDKARNIRRAWLLDQIDLRAADNLLRVQGHAMVDEDGSLAGALLIGLPDKVANSFAPQGSALRDSLFNASGEAGYLWLRLNLSGTLDTPQEDLSVRLMTLLGNLPEAAGKAVHSASDLLGLFFPAKDEAAKSPEAEQEHRPDTRENRPGGFFNKAGNAAQESINSGLRALF